MRNEMTNIISVYVQILLLPQLLGSFIAKSSVLFNIEKLHPGLLTDIIFGIAFEAYSGSLLKTDP